MAISGHLSAFFINGVELTAGLTNISATLEVAELETTQFQNADRTRLGSGLYSGTMSVQGIWDDDANALDPLIQGLIGTSDVEITALLGLRASGAMAAFGVATVLSYPIDAPVDGLLTGSFELAFSGGAIGRSLALGFCLDYDAAVTLDGAGSTVDYGANAGGAADPNSNLGAISMLHVFTDAGGAETIDCEVQDSTNNSVWATFDTFAQLGAVGSELIYSGATDQMDRYVRGEQDVSATGTWGVVISTLRIVL